MRVLRIGIWAAALPFIIACSGVKTHTDYDATVDFSQYKSYYWAKTPSTRNPLMADRIVAEVDGQLYAKGWRKTVRDSADAVIAAHVTTREQESINTMYNNMEPGWYAPGGAAGGSSWAGSDMSTSTVTFNTVGTLIVDILDTRSKKAIWHTTAETTVTNDAQDVQQKIYAATVEMFKDFPPPKSGVALKH